MALMNWQESPAWNLLEQFKYHSKQYNRVPKHPQTTKQPLHILDSKMHQEQDTPSIYIYFFNWKGKKFYVTSLHWFLKTLIADTLKPVVGETWRYLRNKKKICNLFPDKTHPDNECYPNEIRNLFLMKFMDWKVMGAKAGREGKNSERGKPCVLSTRKRTLNFTSLRTISWSNCHKNRSYLSWWSSFRLRNREHDRLYSEAVRMCARVRVFSSCPPDGRCHLHCWDLSPSISAAGLFFYMQGLV